MFWGFFEQPPTYVGTFLLHKVRENCHFLDHPSTLISLRNIKMAPYPGKYVLSILKKSVIVANLDGKCQTHPTQIRSPWQKGQLKNTDYQAKPSPFAMRHNHSWRRILNLMRFSAVLSNTKSQLISEGLFVFFSSPKKRTKNFCTSRLGQKLTFSSSFFWELKTLKFLFQINWPLS